MRNQLMARQIPLFLVVFLTVLFFIAGQARVAGAVTVLTEMEGGLVKGSAPEVYFVGTDDKRYVFPNEKVFHSWYEDFSTVKTLTDEELAAYSIGGNVTYRPGTRLIKVQSDPKVYAVAADGTLRWVSTEALAQELYGSDWAQKVDDVPDTHFINYKQGEEITNAGDYDPAGEKERASTISRHEAAALTANQTPETTGSDTNTPALHEGTEAFKIVKAEVFKMDQNFEAAEDVRIFGFEFNMPPTGARLTIIEKHTGATFFTEAAGGNKEGNKALMFIPDNWPSKLKPNTTYSWKFVAYAAEHATAREIATTSGEFTTGDYHSSVAVDPNEPFKIVKQEITNLGTDYLSAPDVRTFTFAFNKMFTGASFYIIEKATGKTFHSQGAYNAVADNTSIRFTPKMWNGKLKSNTTYTWNLVAYAAANAAADETVKANGEFTTDDFYISTETQNNTSSGSSTTPATGVSEAAFKVTSVIVAKTDAQNSPAEDVRSFDITFSEPAKGVRLMITEKESGTIFYSQPVNEGKVIESTVRVAPSDWTTKLKPSTVYTWKVVAYSSEKTTSERLVFDIATGEFTTTDFTPVSSANGG